MRQPPQERLESPHTSERQDRDPPVRKSPETDSDWLIIAFSFTFIRPDTVRSLLKSAFPWILVSNPIDKEPAKQAWDSVWRLDSMTDSPLTRQAELTSIMPETWASEPIYPQLPTDKSVELITVSAMGYWIPMQPIPWKENDSWQIPCVVCSLRNSLQHIWLRMTQQILSQHHGKRWVIFRKYFHSWNRNFKTLIHQIVDEWRMNPMSSFGFPSIFYNFEESIHGAK